MGWVGLEVEPLKGGVSCLKVKKYSPLRIELINLILGYIKFG